MISLLALALLSAAPAVDTLARVSKAIDCKPSTKDPLRAWCGATLTTSAGFKTPKDQTVLLGISVPLPANKDVRETLLAATRVSALSFSGGKVKLTDVTPDTESEAKQLLEVAGQVSVALKGLSPKITISPDLEGFLPVLVTRASKDGAQVTDSAKGPAQVTLKNSTRMWTVKTGTLEVYVVAEDTADGAWLSVFPVVPASSK
jgi:hypothetical protein